MPRSIALFFFLALAPLQALAAETRENESGQETRSDASPTAAEVPTGKCGFVSTRQGVPPESEGIYPANITKIDGDSTSFMRSNRLKVSEGRHELTVAELINQTQLSNAQLVQIRKMKKFAYAKAYKTLAVDVKPDVTYRIGSRLHKDKLDAESIRANEYWDPIVWQEVPESCS